MPKHLSHLSAEWLPNGLLHITDRRCSWSACYNADGTYRHGAVETAEYTELAGYVVAGLVAAQ